MLACQDNWSKINLSYIFDRRGRILTGLQLVLSIGSLALSTGEIFANYRLIVKLKVQACKLKKQGKFRIPTIYNFAVIYPWNMLFS